MNRKTKWMMVLFMTAAVVLAACSGGGGGGGAAATYSVGGTVAGLNGTVVLQNNGTDDLSVSANTPFTFATKIADGGAYNITVKTQPATQICTASSNTGSVGGADVTNVAIACEGWTGTKQLGVSGKTTWAKGVAVDPNGNVYVAGYTDGGLDGNTLTGLPDYFLVKYDRLGNKIFTKQTGTSPFKDTRANGVASDNNGNIFVAGNTSGGLDGNAVAGTFDAFVTKYTPEGSKVFTRQTGTALKMTQASGVATDANGNVFVAGYTNGGLDGNTLSGTWDAFVSKYTATGSLVFTKQTGTTASNTFAMGAAADPAGNVYIAGSTEGGLFGALTGVSDLFIVKYDPSGNILDTRQTGTAGAQIDARGIAVDSNGNVYVAGFTDAGLDGNALIGTKDAFVSKFTTTLAWVYTRQIGTVGVDTVGESVAVDPSGNVYVTGMTNGGLDGNTLTGTTDLFVVKYSSVGTRMYTRQLGVSGQSSPAYGIAVDADGNAYVTGYTTGGLDGNTLTGGMDLFVVKYDSAGNKQ